MEKKVNVLLINPSSMPAREQTAFLDKSSILRVPSFSMPIGLMDLAAFLRRNINNTHIEILDIGKDLYKVYMNRESTPPMSLESFIETELDKVEFQPDLVGISILFSAAHSSSLKIAKAVRKRWPDAIIVCGGNHATNYYYNLLSNPNVDYVVRGEGELSFTEFVRKAQKGEKDIDVFGIITRAKLKNGSNQLSPMIQNLDEIPLPAFDLLDIETYRKTVGGSIMFSRGCVYRCTFCASHTVHGRKIRYKSNERITIEFQHLINEYGFGSIIIEDDLFASDKKKFLDLAHKIAALNFKVKFYLPQGLSVHTLDEEIIDVATRIGIDEAAVAIESGSPYTQKHLIKKNISLTKARRILEYLRKKDFWVYVNFILGFPGETRELMQETIDFINTIDVDWVYIFHAIPLPGSEMFQQFVSMGVIDPDKFDWDGVRLGRRTFNTPEITAEELEQLIYDTNIDCNFFNNKNLKCGRYEKAVDLFTRFIIEPYPFHIVGYYCRALAYLGMKEEERASADFRECVKWILKNDESKRLFDRYGGRMPLLQPYLNSFSSENGSNCLQN